MEDILCMCLGSLREEEVSFWVLSCCHYTALYLTTALYVSSAWRHQYGLGAFFLLKKCYFESIIEDILLSVDQV